MVTGPPVAAGVAVAAAVAAAQAEGTAVKVASAALAVADARAVGQADCSTARSRACSCSPRLGAARRRPSRRMGGRHHPRASCSDACTSPHDCHRSRLPPRSIGSSRSSVACWPCGCTRAEAREAVRGAAPEQSSGTRSLWRRNFVTPTCTGGRCLAWGMRCNGSRSQPGREACCSRRGARSRAPASRGGGRRSSRLEAQTVEAAAVELRAASVVAGSVETRAGAAEATGSVEAAAGSRAGAQAAVMAAGTCGATPG